MSSKLQFPMGLRVVVVDDDPTCLMVLEQRLKSCEYEVTKCRGAEIALKLFRDNKGGFDLVISDVHMPGMDGFGLLEQIGLEMDLPVIMMSADDSTSVVMKGVNHGACHYLIKPVCMEELKNIWQHVVRKNKDKYPLFEVFDVDCSSNSKKRKDREEEDIDESNKRMEEELDDDECRLKKKARRVNWTVDLKHQFLSAVDQLGGIDKAVPDKIVKVMNIPGITRDNVASHLQKYRQYLRKLSRNEPLNSKKKGQVNFHSPQPPLGNYSCSQMGNEIGSLSLPSSSMIMNLYEINNIDAFNSSEMEGFVPSYNVFNQGLQSSFQASDVPETGFWNGEEDLMNNNIGAFNSSEIKGFVPSYNVFNQGLQSCFQASNVPETGFQEDLMSVVLFKPNEESSQPQPLFCT